MSISLDPEVIKKALRDSHPKRSNETKLRGFNASSIFHQEGNTKILSRPTVAGEKIMINEKMIFKQLEDLK